MLAFEGVLTQIFTGAAGGRTSRWTAAPHVDRMLLAHPTVGPLFWPGSGPARPVPGLPDSSGWEGVAVICGHAMLWRGETIKWADKADSTLWVPVRDTVVTGRGKVQRDVVQPAVGSSTGQVYLTEVTGGFSAGQFVRIVSDGEDPTRAVVDYYKVEEVTSSVDQATETIDAEQTIAAGETETIWLVAQKTWAEDAGVSINGNAGGGVSVEASRGGIDFELTTVAEFNAPDVDATVVIAVNSIHPDLRTGDYVSVSDSTLPGVDIYEVVTPGTALVLKRVGAGSNPKGRGNTYPAGTRVVWQPWVSVENTSSYTLLIPPGADFTLSDGVKLTNLAYTGAHGLGETIPSGAILETLDSNDAGEAVLVGTTSGSGIFGVVQIGAYGYVLRKREIISLQPVGQAQGTFADNSEVQGVGPIGRYAWAPVQADIKTGVISGVAFFSESGVYVYSGGAQAVQVAGKHWDQVLEEFDSSRADEVAAVCLPTFKEVWFVYPVAGSGCNRVLIYNYQDDSVTIDDYDERLGDITTLGVLDWELAPSWSSLEASEHWNSSSKRWTEYVDEGLRAYPIIGVEGTAGDPSQGEDSSQTIPRILLYGRTWGSAVEDLCSPAGLVCEAQTPDFDFEAPDHWKYFKEGEVDLCVRVFNPPHPAILEVYLGQRRSLDAEIEWAGPYRLEVSPGGRRTLPFFFNGSGRFLRLKFRSSTPGVRWDISGYRMSARLGGRL